MNLVEKTLMEEATGGETPRDVIRTATAIDAGRWWRRTRVWVCVLEDALVLLAVARRRYHERVAFADCLDSHYCHTTGQLVLAPVETLRFERIAMSPGDALRVLHYLQPGTGELKIKYETPNTEQ